MFLLLLFYLNFQGYSGYNHTNSTNHLKLINALFYLFFSFIFINNSEVDVIFEDNFYIFWENYYELFLNHNINDFSCFLLSYYEFNANNLVTIGFILFVGSMVCVNLYKCNKKNLSQSIVNFTSLFNLFYDLLSFNFIRKQNLFYQNLNLPTTRTFSKKF